MTLKELKDRINAIPEDCNDYEITTTMSDYDVESKVVKVSPIIYMENKVINIHLKR
jgi:hypothetical protein